MNKADLNPQELKHLEINKNFMIKYWNYSEEQAEEEALKKAFSNRRTLKKVGNFKY